MNTPLTTSPPALLRRLSWVFRDAGHQVSCGWRALCWRLMWLGHKPNSLETFAKDELTLAGWFDKSGFYGGMFGPAVMRLIRIFSDEGHSGGSAGPAIALFRDVAGFTPLTPLTGEDSEWNEVGNRLWQNRRCSHVFKSDEAGAYDIQARIFREPNGACYTCSASRQPVTFPYKPDPVYIDVEIEGE